MPEGIVADALSPTHAIVDDDTPSGVLTGEAIDIIGQLWRPSFPSADLIGQAASLVPAVQAAHAELLEEGPRPYIRIGPGVLEVRTKDYARADRTDERQLRRREVDVDLLAEWLNEDGRFPDKPDPTRVITEWSRKSRANMVRSIGLLDFTPMFSDPSRVPAMVTFTYPGDWLTVAPSGREVKKQLKRLRKRYERAWGEPLLCLWKLEFQQRGAPHVHMMMVPPHGRRDGLMFRDWIKRAWADIVAHPDIEEYRKHLTQGVHVGYRDALSLSDPKRVGVYFSKHSSFRAKEYQNVVPEEWSEPGKTPGRFWGYWGLSKVSAVVEVDYQVATLAARTLRRWAAAQGTTRQVKRPRTRRGVIVSEYQTVMGLAGKLLLASQGETRHRSSRTGVRRLAGGRGFVMVNSGPEMASQLARYLMQVVQL